MEKGDASENVNIPSDLDVTGYQNHVKTLLAYAAMTQTLAWSEVYSAMFKQEAQAKALLLVAEKMVEVVRAQATVELVAAFVGRIRTRVEDFNSTAKKFPLFAQDFHFEASFNEETGHVMVLDTTTGEVVTG